MAGRQGAVRIGPVSILVVVIILCLAVMATLSITTSEAEEAITTRQEESIVTLYENEAEAQAMLAQLDDALAHARATGGDVSSALASLDLPEGWTYENGLLEMTFERDNGRRLDVALAVATTTSYEVVSWRASVEWNEHDPDKTLWSSVE